MPKEKIWGEITGKVKTTALGREVVIHGLVTATGSHKHIKYMGTSARCKGRKRKKRTSILVAHDDNLHLATSTFMMYENNIIEAYSLPSNMFLKLPKLKQNRIDELSLDMAVLLKDMRLKHGEASEPLETMQVSNHKAAIPPPILINEKLTADWPGIAQLYSTNNGIFTQVSTTNISMKAHSPFIGNILDQAYTDTQEGQSSGGNAKRA
eukprot:Gb_23751 [translate_table: standard]